MAGHTLRSVRLLATLAVATGLAAVLPAVTHPAAAAAQSAGLDEYRFPAGSAAQDPNGGAGSNAAKPSSSGSRAYELPGGYPVTLPVLVLGGLLVAGILARVVWAVLRRARPA
jgi:hypothetical protein